MEKQVGGATRLRGQSQGGRHKHVVLLGMGGSSLAPEVFQADLRQRRRLSASCTCSTAPTRRRCKAVEARIDRRIRYSSSPASPATTTETNSFFYYFWDKLKHWSRAGQHFVAITDPGTALEKLAAERHFRATFNAPRDVGGRYSALTVFGLVPAALIGVDLGAVLGAARR